MDLPSCMGPLPGPKPTMIQRPKTALVPRYFPWSLEYFRAIEVLPCIRTRGHKGLPCSFHRSHGQQIVPMGCQGSLLQKKHYIAARMLENIIDIYIFFLCYLLLINVGIESYQKPHIFLFLKLFKLENLIEYRLL